MQTKGIVVGKRSAGLFDTVSLGTARDKEDFLFLIIQGMHKACTERQAQTVSGFIPSNYGIKYDETNKILSLIHFSELPVISKGQLNDLLHDNPNYIQSQIGSSFRRVMYSFDLNDMDSDICSYHFSFLESGQDWETIAVSYADSSGVNFEIEIRPECKTDGVSLEKCSDIDIRAIWRNPILEGSSILRWRE